MLKRELHWALLKIQVLEERLRLDRLNKYGPASDQMSDAQLKLLNDESAKYIVAAIKRACRRESSKRAW